MSPSCRTPAPNPGLLCIANRAASTSFGGSENLIRLLGTRIVRRPERGEPLDLREIGALAGAVKDRLEVELHVRSLHRKLQSRHEFYCRRVGVPGSVPVLGGNMLVESGLVECYCV